MSCFGLARSFRFSLCRLLSSLVFTHTMGPYDGREAFRRVLSGLFSGMRCSCSRVVGNLKFVKGSCRGFIRVFAIRAGGCFNVSASQACFSYAGFCFRVSERSSFQGGNPDGRGGGRPVMKLKLLLSDRRVPVNVGVCPKGRSRGPILQSIVRHLGSRGGMANEAVRITSGKLGYTRGVTFSEGGKSNCLFSGSMGDLPSARGM